MPGRAYRRRSGLPGRCPRRRLGPGLPAAPESYRLALLPPGSDAVRRLPVRGTWPSTLRAPAQAPKSSAPRAVFGPAIADCGFREPLAPHLARPGGTIVPALRYLPRAGARSSAGERPLHTREVAGSIPAAPILPTPLYAGRESEPPESPAAKPNRRRRQPPRLGTSQPLHSQSKSAASFWGLADHRVEEVIDFYATREQAEETLGQVLGDEPSWREILSVVPVILGGNPEASLI
jgi:hypothetical protein